MNREQTIELFKFLSDIYPTFLPDSKQELTRKVNTWSNLMKDQDFNRVMWKAEQYAKQNKFPPTVADLSERTDHTRNNDFLERVKKWEREAKYAKH